MHLKNNSLKLVLLIFTSVLLSCRTTPHSTSDTSTTVVYKADEIVFEYHDASVPPDDHRSYMITLNPDKLIYVVDSYGEIIKKDSINIEPNKWKSIKNAFESCGIKNVEERKNSEGCTGGSGNSIHLYINNEKIFSGYQYRCSTFFDGDLDGDLNCFLMTIKQDIASDFFRTD